MFSILPSFLFLQLLERWKVLWLKIVLPYSTTHRLYTRYMTLVRGGNKACLWIPVTIVKFIRIPNPNNPGGPWRDFPSAPSAVYDLQRHHTEWSSRTIWCPCIQRTQYTLAPADEFVYCVLRLLSLIRCAARSAFCVNGWGPIHDITATWNRDKAS